MNYASSRTALIILYVLGLGLLFGLSIWQYQRGLEKQVLAARRADVIDAVLQAAPTQWEPYFYRPGQLTGRWLDDRSIALENRIFKGQVGFEVLTPFRLEQDGRIVMVNRGWVANLAQARKPGTSGVTTIKGVTYQPQKGITLGNAILPEAIRLNQWPIKSLFIDVPAFSGVLDMPLEPVVFVLEADSPAGFTRIWKAAVIPATRHFAYALQWLGLAIVFLVYGVIWFRRRRA